MCGICGAFAYKSLELPQPAIGRQIRDSMAARGPDGSGEWQSADRRVWLGHRRLAIIDLSPAGAQPMLSEDGSLSLTYNGEIYNYKELRRALEAEGVRFRSGTDSEVIIHLYRLRGPAFVSELRGMFAFALWDEKRRQLFAARDPYGIKPFYYADTAGTFLFASSVKALLTDKHVAQSPDPAGVVGFYVFGSVPEPWTIYRDIKALPAGTTMIVDGGGVHGPARYHSIPQALRQAEIEAEGKHWNSTAVDDMRAALRDSVRHHMVADVPIGAFLSAGVDSGALVGLMRDHTQCDIRTVTLAYEEYRNRPEDEAPLAEETARRYRTSHTTRRISAQEFNDDLPRIMAAMDQPSIDGINTWFVSKATREAGIKVAISGVGSDELLGGYSTFRSLPRMVSRVSRLPGVTALERPFLRGLRMAGWIGLDLHPKLAGLMRYGGNLPGAYLLQRSVFLPSQLDAVVADPDFVQEGVEQLRPQQLIAEALEDGPRADFGRVAALEFVLLSAQSAIARYGLGGNGAFARGSDAPRRSRPARPCRGADGTPRTAER